MHAPATLDDAAALLHEFAAMRRTVGFTGAELPRGPAAVPVDEIVSTRALDQIVEYMPSDQIVTVQAGVTIARLQAALRKEGQRLALDPPDAEHATVGGAVASASYGPLRTRYGTTKDTIVGMTIVRADGTIARGGGKVVKNVAGFDIPKLMIGTYGTLAMIGTVTFRLHPLPQATSDVVFPACDAGTLYELCAAMTQAQLEPSAVYAVYDGAAYACCVRFEGFPDGVAAQRDALLDIAKRDSDVSRSLDAESEAPRTRGGLQVKITAPASLLDELDGHAVAPLYACLEDARAAVYPVVGASFVSGEVADTPRTLATLQAARTWAESVGGTLVVGEAPAAVRSAFDAWGTPPAAFGLMRSLKERFDPQGRLNPGGFVGGL